MKAQRLKGYLPLIIIIVIGFLVTTEFLESSTKARTAGVEAASLGVYWDSSCTNKISSIDWGPLSPGSSNTINAYVRNEALMAIRLFLNTTEWNPPQASKAMSLTWNYTGETIDPKEVIPVAFELTAPSGCEGITTFSFNIIISSEYSWRRSTSPSDGAQSLNG